MFLLGCLLLFFHLRRNLSVQRNDAEYWGIHTFLWEVSLGADIGIDFTWGLSNECRHKCPHWELRPLDEIPRRKNIYIWMVIGCCSVGLTGNNVYNMEWCLYCLKFEKTYSIFKICLNEHGEGTNQSGQKPKPLGRTLNQSEQMLATPGPIGQIPTLHQGRKLSNSFNLLHDAGGILRPVRLSQPGSSFTCTAFTL